MPRACVLLAQGFEEIEAVTVIDVLRRAGVDVEALSVGGTGPGGLEVAGSHGVRILADRTLAEGSPETWDMVILPGGMPGATNLRDDPEVISLLKRQHSSTRRIGAICAAPIVLAAAGILEGRRATSYPGFEGELKGATYLTSPLVRDGHVLTSRGPGTAFAFALEIATELQGKQIAESLRSGMLVAT